MLYRRLFVLTGSLLVFGMNASAQVAPRGLPMEQHMGIQATIPKDDDLARFPSIRIDSILSNVPVDDRLNADDVFDRPFTEALQRGMSWYLAQRGLRVVSEGEDLRIAGTLERYEGFKGWGHWGVEINLAFKVFRGTDRLPTIDLHSLLKYSSDHDVEAQELPKYQAKGQSVSFVEVLFTRIGVDLSEKLIDALKDREAALTGRNDAMVSSAKGTLSIDATAPNAAVFIDGQLVGSVPLANLPLAAGSHTIEVKKKGFTPWKETVTILQGAASRLVAELEQMADLQ